MRTRYQQRRLITLWGSAARGVARAGLGLIMALVALTAMQQPAAAGPAGGSVDPAAVERFVTAQLRRTGLPGVSVAITKGDQVLHVGGYGRDSTGAPVTAHTPMRIASLSKSFTALAVMQLVEAGQVTLDNPVQTYLDDFQLADPRGADITVRQLLNHTSGLTDTEFPESSRPRPPRSLQEAVAQLRMAQLDHDPGTRWQYHNPNYHVAARLVEVVSGEPFATYLRRHVFDPLGMAATTTVDDTRQAVPGLVEGHAIVYGRPVARPEPGKFVSGSGGAISTAEDLARWLIMQNSQGRTPDGKRIVTADSVRAMHTPSDPRGRYAFGWMERVSEQGTRQIWHGGSMSTYTAYQFLVPDTRVGVAVLLNSGTTISEDDSYSIVRGLLALAAGRTPPPPPGGLTVAQIDLVLAALTLVTLALGIVAVVRSGRWAARRSGRPAWRVGLRLLPYLLPTVLLAGFPALVGFLFGGREVTWTHLTYTSLALVVWLVGMALTSLGVIAARCARLARLRRRPAG